MKSKVDYFDISKGDELTVIAFVEAHTSVGKDGKDTSQSLDIYKVVPASSNLMNSHKIHYLYAHETDATDNDKIVSNMKA